MDTSVLITIIAGGFGTLIVFVWGIFSSGRDQAAHAREEKYSSLAHETVRGQQRLQATAEALCARMDKVEGR